MANMKVEVTSCLWAEFRFDVGSGPVAIISDEISLRTWHTLQFKKDRNAGQLLTMFSCYICATVAL